jgi:hypothetical protein
MGLLSDMFESGLFQRSGNANSKHLWYGTKDAVKYGVALANEWHSNHALNQSSLEGVLAAKAAGKIDAAMIVEVKVTIGDDGSRSFTYIGERDAAEVRASLQHETPRIGRYGAYWVRTSFVNDDDPF